MNNRINKSLLKEQRLIHQHNEWNKKSKTEKFKFISNKILNSDSHRKCNDFINHLSNELDIRTTLDYQGIYYMTHNGRTEREVHEMSVMYKYQTDKFRVLFRPYNNNTIELFEIDVFPPHQNQGIGTSILNDILDVVDKGGFRISVSPSVSSNKLSKKERMNRVFGLRVWFKSFGFKNQKYGSHMIYEPQKTTLMKKSY